MHDEGHLAHLAALFNDTKYADMVLVAEAPEQAAASCSDAGSADLGMLEQQQAQQQPERRRFYCHRAILASRSTYFDRMFGSGAGRCRASQLLIRSDGLCSSVCPFSQWQASSIFPAACVLTVLTGLHLLPSSGKPLPWQSGTARGNVKRPCTRACLMDISHSAAGRLLVSVHRVACRACRPSTGMRSGGGDGDLVPPVTLRDGRMRRCNQACM